MRKSISARGFTLAEAAVSAVVLGMLAGAVLSTVSTAAAGRRQTADRAAAHLLAESLVGEIRLREYAEPGSNGAVLGPDAPEAHGGSRETFDDVDDYHGLIETPPRSMDGSIVPGTSGWTRETRVDWVSGSNPSTVVGVESSVKLVTVVVKRGSRTLATSRALRSTAAVKSALGGRTVTGITAVTSVDSLPADGGGK